MTTNKRQSLRLRPSQRYPIKVEFKQKELRELSLEIKVLDISVGGIGLQIPDAESIFKTGMSIENMEVPIPGEGVCVLAGKVTFLKGEKCGINFLESGDHELDKIARYIFNREREIQQLNKKKPVHTEPDTAKKTDVLEVVPQPEQKKVLIVDKNRSLRDSYSKFFLKHGFEVIEATDGAEGIKNAIEKLPDLILMGIHMQVMNGIESTKVIKNHSSTKHIPVFILSSENKKDIVIRAIRCGASDYIMKAMGKDFILTRIQQYFANTA